MLTDQSTDDPTEPIASQVRTETPGKVGDHRYEIGAGGDDIAIRDRVAGRFEVDAHVAVGLTRVSILASLVIAPRGYGMTHKDIHWAQHPPPPAAKHALDEVDVEISGDRRPADSLTTSNGNFAVLFGKVPDFGVFGLIRQQEPDRDRDRGAHESTDDVQPSPSRETEFAVQSGMHTGLEEPGCGGPEKAGDVPDCDTFGEFGLGVP